ncbi:unnamed protein product [Agarophyton chilense]
MARGEKVQSIGNQLDIQIEASNLANMDVFSLSDPFALLEEQENGHWEEIGRTETIWDVLNPKWVRTFVLPAETPVGLPLRVTIYDRDSKTQNLDKQEVIGSCVCRVEDIMKEGCNGKTMELENKDLKETGSVTVIGELYDPAENDHEIFLGRCKFRNNSFFGMFLIRPYIVIYRRRANNEWAPIFRSSPRKRGEDAAFSEDLLHRAKLRTYKKNGGHVEDTPLRIELRSHKSITEHKLIGAVQMSLGSLRRQGERKKISLGLAGESVGELIVTRATLADNSSSFDFEVCFRS